MNIRIIVAEDNDVLLEDLCQELNGQPDFQVVATTSSGVGAVEAALAMEFDVILLDIEMETIQAGIDAAAAIHPQKPEAKIIYLTAHDNDDMILTAMATGERTQRVMLQEYSRLRHNETSLLYFVNTLSLLTPTERELVRYLLQGLNARQISEVRVVAQDTVKTQIHSIREKFGCARTKEIVLRIRELGLEYLFR